MEHRYTGKLEGIESDHDSPGMGIKLIEFTDMPTAGDNWFFIISNTRGSWIRTSIVERVRDMDISDDASLVMSDGPSEGVLGIITKHTTYLLHWRLATEVEPEVYVVEGERDL